LGIFSTGTEKEENAEISGGVCYILRENGAQFGRIFSES
jgi:hypothetical protein